MSRRSTFIQNGDWIKSWREQRDEKKKKKSETFPVLLAKKQQDEHTFT